ncbi:MAG: RNA polymerase factor sigma-54 [Paludibacteraceae bacterium]|nr:RNA polymerase factor sigma-54 [Paludibacteraceae bacterium]
MLKLNLQTTLQQKLSPQQIQLIRMIEDSALVMEERIKQEIEDNPALEVAEEYPQDEDAAMADPNNKDEQGYDYEDDFGLGDYKNEDDIPDYKLQLVNGNNEDKRDDSIYSTASSLYEHLIDQLRLKTIPSEMMELAEYVVGNVDQDGYLRREVEAMVDDYSFQQGVQVADADMAAAVELVQHLDPAGIGATNLQECLILQLERKVQTDEVKLAIDVLQNCFEEFSKKHYDKVIKRLSIDEDAFRTAVAEIVKLNPKPGASWTDVLEENSVQVVPDFILENQDGELYLSLNNRSVPELRISRSYSDMLEEYSSNKNNQSSEMKDAVSFVKQKLDAAKWFINAVKQRQETLQRTMQAIINRQREFFLDGDETKLKPMILKNISDDTGYDISTISRVSNSKFIQTNFGVYPLKYFFSETMQNDQGEDVSTIAVKKILQECIEAEDKRKPLTDDQLTEILSKKGYPIARRTVAKYREQLNIPVSRLRKEI